MAEYKCIQKYAGAFSSHLREWSLNEHTCDQQQGKVTGSQYSKNLCNV